MTMTTQARVVCLKGGDMYTKPLEIYVINEDSVLVELRDKETGLWKGYACLGGQVFLDCRSTVYQLATDGTYGCWEAKIQATDPICYLTREGTLIRSRG